MWEKNSDHLISRSAVGDILGSNIRGRISSVIREIMYTPVSMSTTVVEGILFVFLSKLFIVIKKYMSKGPPVIKLRIPSKATFQRRLEMWIARVWSGWPRKELWRQSWSSAKDAAEVPSSSRKGSKMWVLEWHWYNHCEFHLGRSCPRDDHRRLLLVPRGGRGWDRV